MPGGTAGMEGLEEVRKVKSRMRVIQISRKTKSGLQMLGERRGKRLVFLRKRGFHD